MNIRELITNESPSTQFVLIGLLAVALAAFLTRAMAFFHRKKAGVRPIYPSGWSAAQCRALERLRLLVGLAIIPLWGSFLFIAPSVAAKWSAGCNFNVIFIIFLLLISNAWVLFLIPRNWEKFGAMSRSFGITITFLVVWWGATFTATGWMFAKASASPTMHAISGVYAAQSLPSLARPAN
jgi:hypothetical protein